MPSFPSPPIQEIVTGEALEGIIAIIPIDMGGGASNLFQNVVALAAVDKLSAGRITKIDIVSIKSVDLSFIAGV